jgi:hypothetical protein
VLYKISVKTGDVRGAGTDANVFTQLFGETSDTGERKLEASGNNFERGHTDTFGVEAVSLGELTRLRIGHGKVFSFLFIISPPSLPSSLFFPLSLCSLCLNVSYNRWQWFWKWLVS